MLLIDDHAMFREGLTLALAQADPTLQIHSVASGAEALELLQTEPAITTVMMDYYLPDIGGAALLQRLRQLRPGVRILALSASEDQDDVRHALASGAHGFIHKSADSKTLFAALTSVMQGRGYLPPAYVSPDTDGSAVADDASLLSSLTPRQMEVLRLMCDGLRNAEIGAALGMGEKTVKAHVTAILSGLGVLNRTQATMAARRAGLLGKPR
ncbi:response regulator [Herbaspirillum autotrophicum]|uniref:response regulator n=1 Tax=Herbaspirillum autotrophicum TaxID=180195 RepID=UPI0022B747AB|nr:response regulator transcription factor [Herbaspirillum autotrophicum]